MMPFEDTRILEFNQYQKSDKEPFIIKVDLECIIEKIDERKNNSEDSTISLFRSIENKHDVYRSKDSMKKFYEYLSELLMQKITFKKNKNEIINKRAARII